MTLHSQGGAGAPRTLVTVAADAGRGLSLGFPPRLCASARNLSRTTNN